MSDFQEYLKYLTDIAVSLENATWYDETIAYYRQKEEEVDNFLKTGSFKPHAVSVKAERITNVVPNAEESKENEIESEKNNEKESAPKSKRCTRSKTLKDNQNVLNIQALTIKEERLSDTGSLTSMPPPKQPVRKGKPKKAPATKVVVKTERESDVIIQLPHISTISLSDSDEEQPQEKPVRSTRTKTRGVAKKGEKEKIEETNVTKAVEEPIEESTKKTKTIKKKKSGDKLEEKPEISIISSETFTKEESKRENVKNDCTSTVISNNIENSVPVRSTRTKTRLMAAKTNIEQEKTNIFVTEQSKRSQSPSAENNDNKRKKSLEDKNIANETYVKSPEKPAAIANETVIIPREQRMIVTTPLNKQVPVDDLLTDDEDDRTYMKSKIGTTTKKPIFSQYETSPVKKRVEAFEKLGAEIAAKAQTTIKKNKPVENEIKQKDNTKKQPSSAFKSKQITPLKSGIPTYTNGPSSSSKTKSASKTTLKNVFPAKTISALKTSQQEYIDREARRREKELEVARKKEALLQAKQDEIKRKNAERQLKLAQLRAKQEAEEIERIEMERIKQQKQAKMESLKKKPHPEKKKGRPLYLDMTAPLLPVDDCFDSDDERQADRQCERPDWTRSRNLRPVLMGIAYAGMEVTNTFFMRKATTPNLEEVFGVMNSNKLKRTSSAVWTKPPRFTLMPIPQHNEEEEYVDV